MKTEFCIAMFIIGSCVGSFLCCQARRLHLRSKKRSKQEKNLSTRSICLRCHKQLKWYDNIPVVSWLILRGKCRYCHKKIGLAELLSELGTALAFLLLSFTINISSFVFLDWSLLFITLIFTILLIFLAIYDGIYGELPTIHLVLAIICALIIVLLRVLINSSMHSFTLNLITDPLFSTFILGGTYLALYLISHGKWVGDGDWLLATSIALALGFPWLALISLFLANAIACIIMYPIVINRSSHRIHFGPFLVTAFIITCSFSQTFLNFMI